jgi:uncharacterized cupin superfamily protein
LVFGVVAAKVRVREVTMRTDTEADVTIRKPTSAELKAEGVEQWPIWEKEVSTFPWHYDEREVCFFLEGRVAVRTATGVFEFGAGDLVTFRQGLSCTWEIREPVRKHYRFG